MFDTAAVLVGGRSRRMGVDKSRLRFGDREVLDIICSQLGTRFDRIVIVSDREKEHVERAGREVVHDHVPGAGPLGGLYTAMKHFGTGYIFLAACDMPLIDLGFIDRMKDAFRSQGRPDTAAILGRHPGTGMIEPFHAFYSCTLAPRAERLLEQDKEDDGRKLSLRSLVHGRDVLYIDIEDTTFTANLNRKEDLERFKTQYRTRIEDWNH